MENLFIDSSGRDIADSGFQPLSDPVDVSKLPDALSENFNVKEYVNQINQGTTQVANQAINQVAFMTNANLNSTMAQMGSQYSIPNVTSVNSVAELTGETQSQVMQNYYQGFQLYMDSLDSVYNTGLELLDVQFDAEVANAQNEIAWANETLAWEQLDIDTQVENENYRHQNEMLSIAEQKKAEAKAEAEAQNEAWSSFFNSLGSDTASDSSTGGYGLNFWKSDKDKATGDKYYRGDDGNLYFGDDIVPGSIGWSDDYIEDVITNQAVPTAEPKTKTTEPAEESSGMFSWLFG